MIGEKKKVEDDESNTENGAQNSTTPAQIITGNNDRQKIKVEKGKFLDDKKINYPDTGYE
jgi:hypothetical protein